MGYCYLELVWNNFETLLTHGDGLAEKWHRATLELFQEEIAPVLRREIPSRPFGGNLP